MPLSGPPRSTANSRRATSNAPLHGNNTQPPTSTSQGNNTVVDPPAAHTAPAGNATATSNVQPTPSHHDEEQLDDKGNNNNNEDDTGDHETSSTTTSNPQDVAQLLQGLIKAITEASKSKDTDAEGRVRGADLNPPDEFGGKADERHKLRSFITRCQLVFEMNKKFYKNDSNRIAYAASYLKDNALLWYENALEHAEENMVPTWYNNWTLFKQALETNFGEIDKTLNAEDKLRNLRMKYNDRVVNYTTKFNTLALNVEWNDSALRSQFRAGLASRLLDELARVDHEDLDYQSFVQLVTRIDRRYHQRNEEKQHHNERTSNQPSYKSKDKDTSKDPDSTKNNQQSKKGAHKSKKRQSNDQAAKDEPKKNNTGNNSGGGNRNSSSGTPRTNPDHIGPDGKLKPEELKRRIDKGLCTYCALHKADQPCKAKSGSSTRAIGTSTTFTIVADKDKEQAKKE